LTLFSKHTQPTPNNVKHGNTEKQIKLISNDSK